MKLFVRFCLVSGWRGCLMKTQTTDLTEGRRFKPGLRRRVVLLDKKLCFTLFLSTQVYKPTKCWGGNLAMDLHPSRGEK